MPWDRCHSSSFPLMQSSILTPARLEGTGIQVSKIILGCAIYGSPEWHSWVKDEETSMREIKAAYDMGITTFDTADVYSNGESEVVLGKAIRHHGIPRSSVVVMTKLLNPVTHAMDEHLYGNLRGEADDAGYMNQHGLSRKHIFESIERSLARLQMAYVDVLQCHGFDEKNPISETMQALHDVVKAGHARYIGMFSCRAWEFQAMQNYAIANGLTPFSLYQANHNLLYREDEREMLPMLKYFGTPAVSWSSLARGALVLSVDQQVTQPDDRIAGGRKEWHARIINRAEDIARAKGRSIAQIAIAWLLRRPGINGVVISPPSPKHLTAACEALSIDLSDADMRYLDDLYEPQAPV